MMGAMPTPTGTLTDYRSLSDFRYEIRRFLSFSETAARRAGLEPQQHQALLAIKGLRPGRPATVGVLAERLQIAHHTAVELANRLETKRLVRRRRAESDRRSVVLSLTARGERLLRDVTVPHLAELRTAGRELLQALRLVMAHKNPKRLGDGFLRDFVPVNDRTKPVKHDPPKRKLKGTNRQKEQHR
jgi:DNA-binding MarR family transcriptional regulator